MIKRVRIATRHADAIYNAAPSALGHGFWVFLRNYILRSGFRDAPEGLLQALTAGEGSFYRYAKFSLMNRQNQQPPIGRTLPEPFRPTR